MDGTTNREGFRALRRREDPTGTAIGFQFPNGFAVNLWFLNPDEDEGRGGHEHYRLTAICDIAFRIGNHYEPIISCAHPLSSVGAAKLLHAIADVHPGTRAQAIVPMIEYVVRSDAFQSMARWQIAESSEM